ncbi:MAG: DUF4232 domain-containing protein [Gaiellaceae bacterium]
MNPIRRSYARSIATLTLILVVAMMAGGCRRSGSSEKSVPACDSAQLVASMSLQGATGGLVGGATFANKSNSPCTLTGTPKMTVRLPDGKKLQVTQAPWKPWWKQDSMPKPAGWPRVELKPSDKADVAIRLQGWCRQNGSKGIFSFALPERRGATTAVATFSGFCESPPGSISAMVSPFEPGR